MRKFNITIKQEGRVTKITGLFSCAIDATLAGMDQLTGPHGRVEVKPA